MSHDPESVLRDVFADRAGAVRPPTGVYAAVRRRHRRRQQALVGGTVAVAVAAVGVPTVALQGRPGPGPTAGASPARSEPVRGVPIGEPPRFCQPRDDEVPAPSLLRGLQPQRDVRGSLGGDPEVVTAVLHTAWAMLTRSQSGLSAATARVRSVQRTPDGGIVGTVTATDAGAHSISQATASGADVGSLHAEGGEGGSGLGLPDPIDTPFFHGRWNVEQVTIGCRSYLSVVAPPGSTGTLTVIPEVRADGTVAPRRQDLGLRPDGVAAVPLPAGPGALLRLESAGTVLLDTTLRLLPTSDPTDVQLGAAIAAAPGTGNHVLAAGNLANGAVSARWPRSTLQVPWVGDAPGGNTVAAAVRTLPSGAQVVWGGISKTPGTSPGESRGAFYGLLAAGAFDRSALTWRMPLPGNPLAIVVSSPRAVRIERGAEVRTVTVTGGLVVPDGDTVTAVTVGGRPALDAADLARPAGVFGYKGF